MKIYTFEYNIRLDDLDFMGIVGNSEWITLLTRARIDLLEKINFSFSKMQQEKIGGVVAELNVKFIKSAYYSDRIKISIMPDLPFKKGLVLKYTAENQESEVCLTADVKIIFINASGKPTIMPEKIARVFFEKNTENLI